MMKLIFTLLCIMLIAACSQQPPKVEDIRSVSDLYFSSSSYPDGLIGANYRAADYIIENVREVTGLHPTKPLLISSFVNVDDVQRSSTFGRMLAEQIGSRLAQKGLKIIEVKLRTSSIFVKGNEYLNRKGEGEYLLSRELQDISAQHDAHAVVVGTYAEGRTAVYVTAKLIRTKDSVIISSFDYELPKGPNTANLLRNVGQTR